MKDREKLRQDLTDLFIVGLIAGILLVGLYQAGYIPRL